MYMYTHIHCYYAFPFSSELGTLEGFPYHASPTQRYPGRGQQLQSLSAPLSLSCQFLILLSLLPRRRCLVRLVTRRFRGPRSGHTLELLIPEQIWGKVFFFSISRCTEYYSVVKLFACTPWTSPTGCLTYRRVRALPRALQGVHSCTLYVISLYLTQLEHAYGVHVFIMDSAPF